jgi:hypothetical protein
VPRRDHLNAVAAKRRLALRPAERASRRLGPVHADHDQAVLLRLHVLSSCVAVGEAYARRQRPVLAASTPLARALSRLDR